MNRFSFVAACAALVALPALRPAASVGAAELKPVAVVSIAGYDALLADVDLVGELAGAPELKQGVEGLLGMVTRFQGLAGLSKDKPLGAAIMLSEEQQPSGYVFLPVTDLAKLLDVFQDTLITEVKELEGGVSKIETKGGKTLYVKKAGGWAFASIKEEFLTDLPADPSVLLGDLPKNYDVAVKINIANVPAPLLEMGLDQMRRGAEQALQKAQDDPDAAAVQKKVTEAYLEMMTQALKELDSYTLGVAIDNKTKSAYFDVEALMKDGSELAGQINDSAAESKPSKLPGLADALQVFSLHFNAPVLEKESDVVLDALDQARDLAADKIKDEIEDEDDQKLATRLLNEFLDVVKATIEGGQINGGAVITGEGPFAVVAGAHVVDAKKLEKIFKEVAKRMAEESDDFPEIEFDADKHGGLTFHTFDIPEEADDDENLKKFFGTSTPTVALGFGEDTVVFAISEDPVDSAVAVLAKKSGAAKLPLLQAQLKFGPIMKLAAEQAGDEQPLLHTFAEMLKETEKDHINFTASFIKNGERVRLEIEEGLISAFGKLAMKASKGGR